LRHARNSPFSRFHPRTAGSSILQQSRTEESGVDPFTYSSPRLERPCGSTEDFPIMRKANAGFWSRSATFKKGRPITSMQQLRLCHLRLESFAEIVRGPYPFPAASRAQEGTPPRPPWARVPGANKFTVPGRAWSFGVCRRRSPTYPSRETPGIWPEASLRMRSWRQAGASSQTAGLEHRPRS
jgi:hypothetical protein